MRRPGTNSSASTRSRATRPPVPRPQSVRPDSLENQTSRRFLWGSLLGVWLLSLLPWRVTPFAPDMLLLVIAFWCVHDPNRVGMVVAFVFGLLMDVHDVGPLGQHALIYTLVAYFGHNMHRRILRFELWGQCLHMLPVFCLATMVGQLICAWVAGAWPGWYWAPASLFTGLLWPFVGWLLLIPARSRSDVEVNSV